jgi:hypothetical protein
MLQLQYVYGHPGNVKDSLLVSMNIINFVDLFKLK